MTQDPKSNPGALAKTPNPDLEDQGDIAADDAGATAAAHRAQEAQEKGQQGAAD